MNGYMNGWFIPGIRTSGTKSKGELMALPVKNDLPQFLKKPLFTETDYALVRKALTELSYRERLIINLHFWEDFSVTEIGERLRLPWQVVERCLAEAFCTLRKRCLSHPVFSRSQSLDDQAA